MDVFHDISALSPKGRRLSVAIGNFDGLHLGHQALIEKMRASSERLETTPAVLTFYPHPVEVLRPGTKLLRLMTGTEKVARLTELGVQVCVVQKFDSALAQMSAKDFYQKFLVDELCAASIVVGFNFHFGLQREGNAELLEQWCERDGIEFLAHAPVEVDGIRVSSSAIRECLLRAQIEEATRLLGRPYRIAGRVIRGNGKGKPLGFPTANIQTSAEKLLPENGVYLGRIFWQKQAFPAMVNVGRRPSVTDASHVVVEAHIPNFDFDIYDEWVELDFLHWIRKEQKFESVDALRQQICLDVQMGKDLYNQKFAKPSQ